MRLVDSLVDDLLVVRRDFKVLQGLCQLVDVELYALLLNFIDRGPPHLGAPGLFLQLLVLEQRRLNLSDRVEVGQPVARRLDHASALTLVPVAELVGGVATNHSSHLESGPRVALHLV